ncbi:MAG: Gfo/Idh/MocA family oxidoreductase, partial [Actinomycetota bacterium]|nr:Gfo/Idh/MocA family oxidoreductase [Actinomycetota bacterium]
MTAVAWANEAVGGDDLGTDERRLIGVAVIGAGHWGPNLIRNFHNQRSSHVVWVVDRDEARREHVALRHPEIRIAGDVEAPLSDPAVEAVVVATPTATHHRLVRSALLAGKHVFVEKPITDDPAAADELCRLADAHDLVLMVGHVFVFNAAIQRARQLIGSGDLGRVYYVSMVRTNLGPIRVDVNAAWDLAAHDVAIANYWLDSEPLGVSAMGAAWINTGIEDAIFATLRYPDDVLVTLHASWLNPRKARDITVVGDRRMLTFDDLNMVEPLRVYDHGVTDDVITPAYIDTFDTFRASTRQGDIVIPRVPTTEPLTTECEHFLECVRFHKVPVTDGRSGLAVVRA